MVMLAYGTVGSNDLEKAKSFYDALMGSAGASKVFDHPSGGCFYGKDGNPFFGVLGPFDKRAASVGNGSMFAFRFDSREAVDKFYAKAIALGGTDEGVPSDRGQQMYFSYFRDLDGNKLCAFCVG